MGRNATCIGVRRGEHCGNIIAPKSGYSIAIFSRGNRVGCLCPECERYYRRLLDGSAIQSYSEENQIHRGKDNVHSAFTFSIELETISPDIKAMAELCYNEFFPSHDSTVDIEWKSPIYHGRQAPSKYAVTIQRLMADGNITIDKHCGTHLHIGYVDIINYNFMEILRENAVYKTLFNRISDVLYNDNDYNTQALFGRKIGGTWADMSINYPTEHTNWINVQHDNTVEYRLPRFKSAAQYQLVMETCEKFTGVIINAVGDYRVYHDINRLQKYTGDLITIYRNAVENINYNVNWIR